MRGADEIARLKYDVARIARQIAGLPVRIGESSFAADDFRLFEMTVAKKRSDNSAVVTWLNHDETLAADQSNNTVYDPLNRFSGREPDYTGADVQGSRGFALELGDKWEIVLLEGLAETVVVEWTENVSFGNYWKLISWSGVGDSWDYKEPTIDGENDAGSDRPGLLTITDPAAISGGVQFGARAVAFIANPDTAPLPTYQLITFS